MSENTPDKNAEGSKGTNLVLGLDKLLEPTFELIGQELRDYLKEKIDDWKARKRAKNLSEHLRKVKDEISSESHEGSNSDSTVRQAELFEEWTEGAQEVSPDDKILAEIWQKLLLEIMRGKKIDKIVIEKLKSLSSFEAEILLKFKTRHYLKKVTDKEIHYLTELGKKNLVKRRTNRMFLVSSLLSILATFLVICKGIIYYFTGYKLLEVREFDFFDFYTGSFDLLLLSVAGISVYVAIFSIMLFGFRRWGITWIGREILLFSPQKDGKY